jgi:hypothetical protein
MCVCIYTCLLCLPLQLQCSYFHFWEKKKIWATAACGCVWSLFTRNRNIVYSIYYSTRWATRLYCAQQVCSFISANNAINKNKINDNCHEQTLPKRFPLTNEIPRRTRTSIDHKFTTTATPGHFFKQILALFIRLIIRLFQLIFLIGTVFFSHNKSANSVFQPAYQHSRTTPVHNGNRGKFSTGWHALLF